MPKRSKTPGVKIVKRRRAHGGVTYYGRWRDPVGGNWRDENLTALALTTDEMRKRWARRKADELASGLRAHALGVERVTPADARTRYLADCKARKLRDSTRDEYARATRRFAGWLSARRQAVQDATAPDLWAYRSHVLSLGRASGTSSIHMRRVQAALEWWRRSGWLLLSTDQIRDACRSLPERRDIALPLSPEEIRTLLFAAAAQDDWRAAALVTLALLTGCRIGELERLPLAEVDLDQLTINLGPWVKTHRARAVDLSVCPAAVEVLRAMPRTTGPTIWGQPLSRTRDSRPIRAAIGNVVPWTWRRLRLTCGSYLANAPGIWGGASAYRAARQLGHSVTVAERHYLGVVSVPREATTLEAAMQASSAVSIAAQRVARHPNGDRIE